MTKKVRVNSNKVVVPRPLRPEHGESADAGYQEGQPTIVKDREIETRSHRSTFADGEGDISIIVTAGDAIGDLQISVQYEGQIGQYNECLSQQRDLVHQSAEWLREILDQFGADWVVDIVSAPCPEGDSRILELNKVAPRLESAQTLQRHHTNTQPVRVDVQVRKAE